MTLLNRLVLFFFAAASLLPALPEAALEREEFAMGATMTLTFFEPPPRDVLEAAVASVHRLEAVLSTYRPDSAVSVLNRRKDSLLCYEIAPELRDIIRLSMRFHALTDGAFDPTVHSLVEAWGMETDLPRVPSKKHLRESLAGVGMEKVSLEGSLGTPCVRFQHPAARLNFGAIGKGFAMDRAASILKKGGCRSGVIEFGRSFLLWNRPVEEPFIVKISNPQNTQEILAAFPLREGAVAASSQSEQFFHARGKRYGHIFNPRTGKPVEGPLMSATAVAPTAAEADAFSTAFFVLGREKSLALLQSLDGVEAVFVSRDGGRVRVDATPGLRSRLLSPSGENPR